MVGDALVGIRCTRAERGPPSSGFLGDGTVCCVGRFVGEIQRLEANDDSFMEMFFFPMMWLF